MPALRLARRRDRGETGLSDTRSIHDREQRSRQVISPATDPVGLHRARVVDETARAPQCSPRQRSRQPRQRLGRRPENRDRRGRTQTSCRRQGRWRLRSGRSRTLRLPPIDVAFLRRTPHHSILASPTQTDHGDYISFMFLAGSRSTGFRADRRSARRRPRGRRTSRDALAGECDGRPSEFG